MQSFADVFEAFGGASPFARAIGIPESHGRTMKARGSIPPAYWPRTVNAARELGVSGVTFELLANLHAGLADFAEARA